MFRKLTAYQQAECWTAIRTESHYLSKEVEKLKGDARLIAARQCSERIAAAILKLTYHEAALMAKGEKKAPEYRLEVVFFLDVDFSEKTKQIEKAAGISCSGSGAGLGVRDVCFEFTSPALRKAAKERIEALGIFGLSCRNLKKKE